MNDSGQHKGEPGAWEGVPQVLTLP
jgi:hypothetical protein